MQRRAEAPDELTIDELAQQTGMTVRNVRAHQSRGLLPAPVVRGRTGFYAAQHVARIELIKELQAEGYNLEAIRRLLESAGGSTSEVLGFTRAARAGFAEEEARPIEPGELAARFGVQDATLVDRALAVGIVRQRPDGGLEERSPRLSRAGEELQALGVPVQRILGVAETMRDHADGVARAYVELFLDEVWTPFEAAGRPPERFGEVRDAFERLRPLAAESLLALFGLVMADRVDEALRDQIERFTGEGEERRAS